jgi:RHS repeat-associated protein
LIVSRCLQLVLGLCLGLMSALTIAQTPADIFKKIQPAITYLLEGETVEIYNVYADHLNTPRLITSQANQSVWQWENNDPFGVNLPNENPSGLGSWRFDLRFAGQVWNNETQTAQNYLRDCYVPAIGRFCQPEPLGLVGDISPYNYVRGNPLSGVDPFGLDTLVYKGGVLTHYDSNGNAINSYPATSGVPGVTDPGIKNQGPIPEGRYTINPSEISPAGFFRRHLDPRDWGKYRVPAHPDPGTETLGRAGFFIHGGKTPGSAGCIDVGTADQTLFPQLQRVKGLVPLIVVR